MTQTILLETKKGTEVKKKPNKYANRINIIVYHRSKWMYLRFLVIHVLFYSQKSVHCLIDINSLKIKFYKQRFSEFTEICANI